MDSSEVLMLRGTVAHCPDCGGDRVMLPVHGDEFCCTDCDAAVFVLDAVAGSPLLSRGAA